jgi:hypothetical protein
MNEPVRHRMSVRLRTPDRCAAFSAATAAAATCVALVAIALPAHAAPAVAEARAAGGSAAAATGPAPVDRADLDPTKIIGNRELPKVLYIVPWRKPMPSELNGKPVDSVLDEVLAPVDRDVFRREVQYHAQTDPRPNP